MQDKSREKILREAEEQVKEMVKGLLERIMREERELYLEQHPTKANGYYTRALLTLVGPVEDLRVPRVREGHFNPQILPYRKRTSLELSEVILALFMPREQVPAPSPGSWRRSMGRSTPLRAFPALPRSWEEEVQAWQERPLDEEYCAVFLDSTFLSIRRGRSAKEPVYIALGIQSDGRREILGGFGCLGPKERAHETGRWCSRIFGDRV
ncbi:MAG: transposase [Candidatus Bipolaricaulaceae bacterium]